MPSRLQARAVTRAAVALVLVVLLAACGENERATPATPSAQVVVPDVVGLRRSRAVCALADGELRWRISPDRRILSRPPADCDNNASAGQPDPKIVRQRPAAGARVSRNAVVVLHDECEGRSCA
jgi:beta-lactam-binding protein with PASTA domain